MFNVWKEGSEGGKGREGREGKEERMERAGETSAHKACMRMSLIPRT